MHQVKDYIYISDTKVKDKLDQIPTHLHEQFAHEFSIDFKFVKSTSTQQPAELSRTAMLKAAIRHIESEGIPGTVDEPAFYFRGVLTMLWRPMPEYTDIAGGLPVFFAGASQQTVVALGGSARHLIGTSSNAVPPHISHPEQGFLLRALMSADAAAPATVGDTFELDIILADLERAHPAQERVEFMARMETIFTFRELHPVIQNRLRQRWPNRNLSRLLLGSPLYVGRVEGVSRAIT